MIQEQHEEALEYYNLYAERYPDQSRSFRLLGDYYFNMGNYTEAEKHYERSILLAPDNIMSIGKMAIIKQRQGAFDEAEEVLQEALNKAKTTGDSMSVYNTMMEYFSSRGQIRKVIGLWEQTMELSKREYPPFIISIFRITRLYWYFLIDDADTALEIIKREEGNLTDAFKNVTAYGYINYYINLGDIENAEKELVRLEDYIARYGTSGNIEKFYEGEILFLKEMYAEAVAKFNEFKNVNVYFSKELLNNKIAECYIRLEEFDKATAILEGQLEIDPYQASAHLFLAKIFLEAGNPEKAREHLSIADKVWENADEDYGPVQETRKLLKELGSS
jgi:pentatricopeptide repeat protein